MKNDELRAVIAEIEAAGLDWSLAKGRRHHKVAFTVGGRTFRVVVPSTASDWRAARNARAFVRRTIRQAPAAPARRH